MKIAIYTRQYTAQSVQLLKQITEYCLPYNIKLFLFSDLYSFLHEQAEMKDENWGKFADHDDLKKNRIDFLISIGGDGTLLDTLLLVKDSGIPVAGINIGRLGFLSNIAEKDIQLLLNCLLNSNYIIEKRSLVTFDSDKVLFEGINYALNDFTIHKRDTSSMIIIKTFLNGELFNTYWADGLVVSTPTGSTAYSLSCGGPIIFPESKTFAITPVAPHNLTIRPIIVPDDFVISFEVSGRGTNYLISLDSRYEIIDYSYQMAISKASFEFNLVRLNNKHFIDTLKEKLLWGIDNRNI